MSEPKTTCVDCGVTILQTTADRNDGRCASCYCPIVFEPPPDFEAPGDLVERLTALGLDPLSFAGIAWRDGASHLSGLIDMMEESSELYQRWAPQLREFALDCRRLLPLPREDSLTDCDREKQRIYTARFGAPDFGQGNTMQICSMPLIAMPIAVRAWPFDPERMVLLTPEEEDKWNEIYSHPEDSFWWFAHHWWSVDDALEPQNPLSMSHLCDGWDANDVPKGERPWLVEVGESSGPLAGHGQVELWAWNGRRAKFIKQTCFWVS